MQRSRRRARARRHATLLTALLAAVAPLSAAESEPQGNPSPSRSEPGALDAELLHQVEEAARLEREYRARQREAEDATRSAREAETRQRERAEAQARRGEAAPYEAAIEEQRALQERLLRASDGRGGAGAAGDAALLPAPHVASLEDTDPRVASRAPPDRTLPPEIFDRDVLEVPAGRWGNDEPVRAVRLLLDADGDGKPELIRWLDARDERLLHQEEDRDYDGVLDAWNTYLDDGELDRRVLDADDDGRPDVFERYREGRLVARDLDRDGDGVRDVFYRYAGDSLAEERHDADNDGVIDLVIVYSERLRVRAEQDVDRDGQMDVWTTYLSDGGVERVARVERDRHGRGRPDTIEIFESRDGRSVLLRREEDTNGDGEIDVVSFYVGGKLRRRQIRSPDA